MDALSVARAIPGAGVDETPAAAAIALGLDPAASEPEVLDAIARLRAPLEELEELVRDMVDLAVGSRRVRRIHRAWARAFAQRDPEGFLRFLRLAPVVGFRTATAELAALVVERRPRRGFTGALAEVAAEHPELITEARREATATEGQA